MESSSFHTLNADLPMSKFARLRWLLLNRRNNRAALDDLDAALELRRFSASGQEAHWDRIERVVSPARRLCDLFWLSLDWPGIAAALGGRVRVLEIGCGSGRYGGLLRDCLGGAFERYRGIDVERDPGWSAWKDDSRFELALGNANDVATHVGDSNLIFTQSALEHFDADMTFFRSLQQHLGTGTAPLMMLHLIPSAGCLRTFLWHGVRQYTPRTTSRITRLFDSQWSRRLYALGGANCNRVHRRFITWPSFLGKPDPRRADPASYDAEVRAAIRTDDRGPASAEACFYALSLLRAVPVDVLPK